MFHLSLIPRLPALRRTRYVLCVAAALVAGLVALPQESRAAGGSTAAQSVDRTVMAWRGSGSGSDSLIWWSRFDGASWSSQQALTDRRTEAAPALARGTNGQLLMAWRGTGDNHIWWSQYTGTGWSSQQVLDDRRTDRSPALGL